MTSTYDSVLADPLITLVDSDPAKGIFEIRLGPLKTIITIDVGLSEFRGRPCFLMTHAIHTPLQAFPHKTNATDAPSQPSALGKAILYLTMYYDMACRAGHKPKEWWLVPWQAPEGPPRKIWLQPKNTPLAQRKQL